MSFQPQAPMMMSQPPPPAVAAPKGKRRKGLIILGVILFVVGLVGGGAIVYKSMSNYEEAVKSLARAPVGCTTTLVFDKPATFIIYAETKGKLDDLGGDCEANSGSYEHAGDKLPKVSLTLEDPDGDSVDLQRGITADYDVKDYVGTGVRTMNIEQAGTYHLNVESDESDFAISIGKNPKDDSEKLSAIGGGVFLGGLALGLIFFLLGLRRRRPIVATADIRNPAGPLPGWPPGPYAGNVPTGPPPPVGYPGLPSTSPPTVQQPPIRVPDPPSGGSFAPPTFAPPPPPPTAPDGPPIAPPTPSPVAPAPGHSAAPPTPSPINPVLPPARPPTLPPAGAPPTVQPPVAEPPPGPSGGGWTVPEDRDD
jgi:hypothetical protein